MRMNTWRLLSAIKDIKRWHEVVVSSYTFVINFNNIRISVKISQRLSMIQIPRWGEIVKNFIIREIELQSP